MLQDTMRIKLLVTYYLGFVYSNATLLQANIDANAFLDLITSSTTAGYLTSQAGCLVADSTFMSQEGRSLDGSKMEGYLTCEQSLLYIAQPTPCCTCEKISHFQDYVSGHISRVYP